jgi:hypothetical protein
MASRNRRKNSNRTDITLMTLLANEATDGSRKILKEYGEPDAKDYKDLEVKLAELYFKTPDKVELEKKLSNIHPHKKWLMKYIEPVEKIVEVEKIVSAETKSNANGDCPTTPTPLQTSSFSGETQMSSNSVMGIIGLVAVVGILSLSLIHITKK